MSNSYVLALIRNFSSNNQPSAKTLRNRSWYPEKRWYRGHFSSKTARGCPYKAWPSVKSHRFTDETLKMTVPSVKRQVFTDDLKKLVLIVHPAMQPSCKTLKEKSQILENQRFAIGVPGAGIEPARIAPLVFETSASTDSAIRAFGASLCSPCWGLLFCEVRG